MNVATAKRSKQARESYRWAILAVGTFALGTYSVVRLGLPALAPELRETFQLTFGGVGLVLGCISLGQILTTYTWGWLADVRGERTILVTGLSGAASAMIAAAMASTTVQLAAALLVTGMLGTASVSGSGRAIMAWFSREERGTVLGIRQMAVPVGGAVGASALPLLVSVGSLRASLLAAAALMFAGALTSMVWVKAPPGNDDRPRQPARSPMSDSRMWRLGSAAVCMMAAQASVYVFLVLFLHDHHGVSVTLSALCLAAVQLVGGLTRVVLGRRSDRRRVRVPLLRRISLLAAVSLSATALLADAASPTLAIALMLIVGVLVTSWNGLAATVAVELTGREQAGKALGMQTTIFSFGSGVMPPLFGLVVQWTSWPVAFAVLAASELIATHRLGPLVDEERRLVRPRPTGEGTPEWLKRSRCPRS